MDKLQQVDWRGLLKQASNKVKQYTLNLSPLELKVEDATNTETWGPHGSAMNEIADACYDPEAYRQILGVLARRLQEREERWRCCYKALLLLEHLIKHGPPKIVQDVQSSMSVLERLQHFQYKDPNGRDHGSNVRHRAKELIDLVSSADRIQQEREKAKANRSKYRGVSGDDMRVGGFGSTTSTTYGAGSSGGSSVSTRRPGESWGGAGTGLGTGTSSGGYGGSSMHNNSSSTRPSYSYSSNDGSGAAGYNTDNITSSSPSTGGQGDFLHISPDRPSGGGGSTTEAVAATQERIERLRLAKAEEERRHAMFEKEQQQQQQGMGKKKLADVKVNPKIAASLGLKLPPPASSSGGGNNNSSSSQQQQQQTPTELLADLLGDALTINTEDTNTNIINTGGGGGGDDMFGGIQQPTAPSPLSGGGDTWDAFGDMPSNTAITTNNNNGGGALDDFFGTTAGTGGDVLISNLSPSGGAAAAVVKITKSNQPMAVNAKPTASKDPFADLLG